MVDSILVIGAGELGDAVLHALVSHPSGSNTTIDLLMRPASIHSTDATKQKYIAGLQANKINVVPGDVVQDFDTELIARFSEYDTVINCTGMFLPAGTQRRVAEAVLGSGCRRYFPWQYGIDYDVVGRGSAQDLFTEQLDVRDLLRAQSEVEWVIVSTGIFTSFIFEPAFGIVSREPDVVTALGSWGNRVTATAPEDIGSVVAEIALKRTEVKGIVFAAGDTVSMGQIADVVDDILGRKVRRVEKSVDELKQELKKKPEDGMAKYRIVFGEGRGIAWGKETSFNAQNGIETLTVKEWAEKNLK
jgi:hypothetical protein